MKARKELGINGFCLANGTTPILERERIRWTEFLFGSLMFKYIQLA
jgi:hypothetical protein